MLDKLTDVIMEECQRAKEYKIFGTQSFHIESIKQLEDKGPALNFEVTTWNDQSENARKVKEMSLFEVMDLLGRVIGHRAINTAIEKNLFY